MSCPGACVKRRKGKQERRRAKRMLRKASGRWKRFCEARQVPCEFARLSITSLSIKMTCGPGLVRECEVPDTYRAGSKEK